jgi:hypothetical protein
MTTSMCLALQERHLVELKDRLRECSDFCVSRFGFKA